MMWFLTDEERELRDVCKKFSKKDLRPYAKESDQNETFNLKAFKKMGDLGILGITADREYGGLELGVLSATLVMEELSRGCPSTTLSYLAHSILCINNLQKNASDTQKKKYLPKLISGEHIGCMAISEADFGSDALGMQAKAIEREDHFVITGRKMWITNAAYADIIYLYLRTGSDKKDISTFIIEKNMKGYSVGKSIHKMGMRGSPTGELIFDNVIVPKENLVGSKGDSTYHMMKNLEIERITIAGISMGIAEECVAQSLIYAQQRIQFGKPIGEYQLIQKMIAEMSVETAMMRSLLYSKAKEYDLGKRGALFAAQVKLALPKMATKIALDAIQIHGGYGYSQEFSIERMMRDNKLNEIGAGTNEIMIIIIAKELFKRSPYH